MLAAGQNPIANTQVAETGVADSLVTDTVVSDLMLDNANNCDIKKQSDMVQWIDKTGVQLFKWSLEKGSTNTGALIVLGQGYAEGATSPLFREDAAKSHNWWNLKPIKSQGQVFCQGGNFACFASLKEGFNAYWHRITSIFDGVEWHNPNYNPSFPGLGILFMRTPDVLPTEQEILDALRIKPEGEVETLSYDPHNVKYGARLIAATGTARKDLLIYVNFKLSCYRPTYYNLLDKQEKLIAQLASSPAVAEQLSSCSRLIEDFEKKITEFDTLKLAINATNNIF